MPLIAKSSNAAFLLLTTSLSSVTSVTVRLSSRPKPLWLIEFVPASVVESIMVLLEFSISPLEKGESVGQYVARSLEIVEKSGLDYRLHAMGTIVEGELDQVLDLLKKCFEAMAVDCHRISCTAKIDYRQGASGRLDSKVQSVEEKLGRNLKKI